MHANASAGTPIKIPSPSNRSEVGCFAWPWWKFIGSSALVINKKSWFLNRLGNKIEGEGNPSVCSYKSCNGRSNYRLKTLCSFETTKPQSKQFLPKSIRISIRSTLSCFFFSSRIYSVAGSWLATVLAKVSFKYSLETATLRNLCDTSFNDHFAQRIST